jgi:iron complex transport system substrate-binding protein
MLRLKRKYYQMGFYLLLSGMLLGGLTPLRPPDRTVNAASYLTITDDLGRSVTLKKKPGRVVVISTSLLDLYYGVGGKAVGRIASSHKVLAPETERLPVVGRIGLIDPEKLVALRPDLIISLEGTSEKLIPVLTNNKLPIIFLRLKTYNDVRQKIKLFGLIAGTEGQASRQRRLLADRMQKITAKLPAKSKKIVILHATAKSVTVELENSLTGSIAKMLRLENIAAGSKRIRGDPEATPYSLERLVGGDPDLILITVMGNMTNIERRIRADVKFNPAWANLRAVRNRKVFFLPYRLFTFNPGIHYDQSVAYLAKIAYPEVYANAK